MVRWGAREGTPPKPQDSVSALSTGPGLSRGYCCTTDVVILTGTFGAPGVDRVTVNCFASPTLVAAVTGADIVNPTVPSAAVSPEATNVADLAALAPVDTIVGVASASATFKTALTVLPTNGSPSASSRVTSNAIVAGAQGTAAITGEVLASLNVNVSADSI